MGHDREHRTGHPAVFGLKKRSKPINAEGTLSGGSFIMRPLPWWGRMSGKKKKERIPKSRRKSSKKIKQRPPEEATGRVHPPLEGDGGK